MTPLDNPVFLTAFFHYYPGLLDAVAKSDYGILEKFDLNVGPIIHVVAFVAPLEGQKVFTHFLRTVNPKGLSFHRWNKRDKERFILKVNRHYREMENV